MLKKEKIVMLKKILLLGAVIAWTNVTAEKLPNIAPQKISKVPYKAELTKGGGR